MRAITVVSAVAVFHAGGTLAAVRDAPRVPYEQARSYYESRVNLAEPERERIRRHLAGVEAEMRANPPPGLTDGQLRNRLARLDELHAYRVRGEFPRNRDFPDRLIPYFIDAEGVPCAVGHLLIESGGAAFAEEIRATRNHAYIAELAEMDGRLAAWGEEQGITLEEAAMIQPGYGPPRLGAVQEVGLDASGRPWALGPDNNNIGFGALFYRDSAQWHLHSSIGPGSFSARFSLSHAGEPAIFSAGELHWMGGRAATPWREGSDAAWSDGDNYLATGGNQGVLVLRRSGSNTLIPQQYATPLASDTVTGVAVTGGDIWAATPRGLYRRTLQGNDTVVTVWDSAALGGRNVTGLVSGPGGSVWLGIEGAPSGFSTFFSTRGMRRWSGTGWTSYRAAMSSIFVPGDTVFALATRDNQSVWMAVRAGFFRFVPGSGGGQKVADIPAGVTVFDMAGDGFGFYAGTSAGVYHFNGDSLVFLGQPAVSLRPGGFAAHRRDALNPLRVDLFPRSGVPGGHTIPGSKTGPQTAAGIYIRPAESP
jgi:hypothetical protein